METRTCHITIVQRDVLPAVVAGNEITHSQDLIIGSFVAKAL